MRVTHTLQACVREPERASEIMEHIANGHDLYGMQTFDQHIVELVHAGAISLEVAKHAASRPGELERTLMLG